MNEFIKVLLEVAVFCIVTIVCNSLYRKRIKKKKKGSRFYVIFQTVSLFFIYAAIGGISESIFSQAGYDQIMNAGAGIFILQCLIQVKHFIWCEGDIEASALVPVIQQYKQIKDTGYKLVDTGINEEEHYRIKGHINYILGHIEQQAPAIPDGEIDFKLSTLGEKYYISLKYTCAGEERGRSKKAKEELNDCIRHLAYMYEVRQKSYGESTEVAVYFN